MRHIIIVLGALSYTGLSSAVQVSIGISVPGVSLGINLPVYPELDVVPGYPVYYAPDLDANYFFYDGTYWLYQNDNWYASSWYNGPWGLVNPDDVPAFILRVPVRYYREPPPYFRAWGYDTPPRWGEHWGPDWAQRRTGWDRWDRGAVPAPAPLPAYQRNYSGDRYPRQVEQQQELNRQNYRYQPNNPVVRQQYPGPQTSPGFQRYSPSPSVQQGAPQQANPWLGSQRYGAPASVQQGAPQQPAPGPQRYGAPAPVQQAVPQQTAPWYPRPSAPAPVQQGAPQQTAPWYPRPSAPAPVQQGAPQQTNPWLQGLQRYGAPPSVQPAAPSVPRAQTVRQGVASPQGPAATQAPLQQRTTGAQSLGRQPSGTVQTKQQNTGSQGPAVKQPGKSSPREEKGGQ
ncbi:MAG: hypothetical protein ACLPXB_07495 [Thiobacillaceae bacterium]